MEPITVAVLVFFILPVGLLVLASLCAMFDGEDE